MAPVGARKDWAVSGERLAFDTTKNLGVKVKSGKVGNTCFVDPTGRQDPLGLRAPPRRARRTQPSVRHFS